jgi:hypothetical protein
VDQATEATTATAPAQTRPDADVDSFEYAATVAAEVVGPLTRTRTPSSVRIEPNWPSGWGVVLTFLSDQAVGVFDFATSVDVPVTQAQSGSEIHLEADAYVHGIEIRAFALVTAEQAAQLENPSSTVATASAPAEHQDVVDDVARCARCGCTEDAACKSGCYWVPNQQLIDLCSACATPDELAAITYTPQAPGGDQ